MHLIRLAAFALPWISLGLVATFVDIWIATSIELRVPYWLVWKFLTFWMVHLWGKVMCYAMTTDTLALVMMFGQVRGGRARTLALLSCTGHTLQPFPVLNPRAVELAVSLAKPFPDIF